MSLVVAAAAILIMTLTADVADSWGFRGSAAVFAVALGTVGAVVSSRRPENVNGWLFCTVGLVFGAQALLVEYVNASVLVVPGGLPLTAGLAWVLVWLWVPAIGIVLIFLPLVFPTGRLLSPRWRIAVAFGVLAVFGFGVANAFLPGPIDLAKVLDNPLGAAGMDFETYNERVLGPASLPLAIAIVLAGASLVLRFNRASGDLRQQIKWFALASIVAGVSFAIYGVATISGAPHDQIKALEIVVTLGLVGVPAVAGLAILRFRLYDVDRIISRTIAYGGLSALLLAAYILATLVLQGPLGAVTGGDAIAVAISTLIVAGCFQPVRRRVQTAVDRRFDRARFDAERTISAFSERLRDEVDIVTVTTDLDWTVRSVLRPAGLGLWLRRRVE